jgi:asparagine synthase (glutamine-hydrolysing)
MCGLFGAIATNIFLEQDFINRARSARDMLAHRGPDQSGEWYNDDVYIGHRRLSILDTSIAGQQPMKNERAVVTVNGEIYNFQTLRTELQSHGFEFKSSSDSEVVLHGYNYWGIDLLAEKIDGMYAIVIYDVEKKKLFVIRDRVGIKPFYYYFDDEFFSWASEIKSLTDFIGQESLKIDNTAVIDFLTYRYIPAPKSIYKKVFKLPAASILTFSIDDKKLKTKKYWSLNISESKASDEILEKELINLLSESTAEQLVSDVPLGLLLSGGIDSSVIAALAVKNGGQLQSFSMGFSDIEKDETKFAEIAARHIGTNHHIDLFENAEMSGLYSRMLNWFDEPFGDTSAVPTYRVCKYAKANVTVALSGDGGDELFGGYSWYHKFQKLMIVHKFLPFLPKFGFELPNLIPGARRFELLTIGDPLWLYARLRGSLSYKSLEKWKKRLNVDSSYDPLWAYRAHYHTEFSPRKAAQIIDFHTYLPDDILTKVDRVSMAVSLECRPPFLSKSVVEHAFNLPDKFLYKNKELKGGLKTSIKELLPKNLLTRKKQGFGVPDFGWKKAIKFKDSSIQEGILKKFLKVSDV